MERISVELVHSLTTLGLSKYEAKIYAALILFDRAEAKDLIEFLDISKPSVYAGLEHLMDMGLATKQNSKPAVYGGIHPDLAIKMLMERYREASDRARTALAGLEIGKIPRERSDALWTVWGEENISSKVREMLKQAIEHIHCLTAERYLPLIESLQSQDVALKLMVISDRKELEVRLKNRFRGKNREVHVIPIAKLYAFGAVHSPVDAEISRYVQLENLLELITDDAELLFVPPVAAVRISGLNTSNPGMIQHTKLISRNFWDRLIS
jgi:sugar-specific transcriptional regulator TrmB